MRGRAGRPMISSKSPKGAAPTRNEDTLRPYSARSLLAALPVGETLVDIVLEHIDGRVRDPA